ncbi:unnamed protein product [Cuscuta campestris]|uniref:Uncharacterized protein n=1 Tax=Cuscuta campestris TaxID=132261 RepID=A0A484KUT4_9ASTE|nr:unnamed protein product [Cuscuta campestris]
MYVFFAAPPTGADQSSPDIARVVAGGWTGVFAGKPAEASSRIRRCSLKFLSRFKIGIKDWMMSSLEGSEA